MAIVSIAAVSSAQAREVPSPWTWTDYGPALRDVSCSSPGFCAAVGQRGVTLRNARGGENALAWSKGFLKYPEELTGVTCRPRFCLAVSNTRTSAATFVSKVYRSTDEGGRWSLAAALGPAGRNQTRSAVALACDPEDTCYAVGPGGGVWRSLNQGRVWQALVVPVTQGSYRHVACPSPGTCVAVGGDSDGSSALIAGNKVTELPLPKAVSGGLHGLACDKPTRCTATDGGAHFMSLSIPDGKWGAAKLFPNGVAVSALACPEENVCVGLTEAPGTMLRTTNLSSATGDWHRRPLGTMNLEAITCAHADCVAVGKAATWWVSFDAGSEFRRVNEVAKLDAIQCSAEFKPTCVAGGMQDLGVSRSEGELWSLPLSGILGLDMKSVNCTGPSECLLLGKTLTLFTTNLKDFPRRHPAAVGPNGADTLTCITKDLCVGFNQGVVYTTLDAGLTPWTHSAFPGTPKSVACFAGQTNPAECLVVTTTPLGDFIVLGTMTQTGGEIGWNWVTTDADPSSALSAIGCSPIRQCTAVGKDGEVMNTIGTNVMKWIERIIPSAATDPANRPDLTSVSCPAKYTCLAGGIHGADAIVASTTNNWVEFSYDKIQGIEGVQTITGIGCETADRCVAVGNSALVGVRKR